MPTFLIRDDAQPAGYIVHQGPLERSRELSYVPWALTADRRVVYARTGEHRNRASRQGLTSYDTLRSKERRQLCQSALGSIALTSTQFSAPAVRKVSTAVKAFLRKKLFTDMKKAERDFGEGVGKYLYGMKYVSFGRISDVAPTGPNAYRQMWEESMSALEAGRSLSTILSIHDGVARTMIKKGDKEEPAYAKWAAHFRANKEGEMFHEASRGREKISAKPTTTAGIVGPGNTGGLPAVQLRNRGVDMYKRTAFYGPQDRTKPGASEKASAVNYYRQLDEMNELFGAGPSGTTGTILAGAMTFGNLAGDELKQYLFAVMGYLVGGGMHSLHESLSVMKWLGPEYQMEYNPGSFLSYQAPVYKEGIMGKARADDFPALPQTFLQSSQFAEWRDTYYDIVVLGGIHWMFNGR